jgi:UDP-N-acetylglucosamine--N-acetylmuramyl-(pentapeptide) pyrophosphoryl-undecaprenol N-acetylglucosamine transferase
MAPNLLSSIAYVAGKSGGHIIPCLTLMLHNPTSVPPLFFTTDAALDQRIVQTSNIEVTHVPLPLSDSYSAWYKKIVLLWHLIISFCVSFYMLWQHQPTKLVTTGGLVAVPVCCAAYILRIPIELYELNALPGKSARFIGRMATNIYVCFADAQYYFNAQRCSVVPYPLRYTDQQMLHKEEACQQLGFTCSVPTLLILGGSQGSLQLNALIRECVALRTIPLQIIHQTGSIDSFDWVSWYKAHNVAAHVFAYHTDLAPYITASDVVICRAGAGTLFELVYFKKQCIIIPLEGAADDHQVVNAYAMQRQYPDLCTVLRCAGRESGTELCSTLMHHITNISCRLEGKESNVYNAL